MQTNSAGKTNSKNYVKASLKNNLAKNLILNKMNHAQHFKFQHGVLYLPSKQNPKPKIRLSFQFFFN